MRLNMRNRIVDLIEDAAANDPDTLFLTGDIGFSVVEKIRERLGDRFINAGVAEANMATMAGALALNGFRVYIYSIAPFVTLRCIEQLRNDVCYQGRNVRILGIGAGLSYGTLGPSHHSLEDATILGALPGMHVLCPAGCGELDVLFDAYRDVDEPIYFRIGRERGPDLTPTNLTLDHPAWIVRPGTDATAICSGAILEKALSAADRLSGEGLSLQVVSAPLMHPFPAETVAGLLADGPVVSVCEAYPGNPLEVGVMRMLLERGKLQRFQPIDIKHSFPKRVANHDALRENGGVSVEAIVDGVRRLARRAA
jgi:transketolase